MFRQKRHKNELLLKEKLYKYWAICLVKKKKKKKKGGGGGGGVGESEYNEVNTKKTEPSLRPYVSDDEE